MIIRNCLLILLCINFGLTTVTPRGRTEPTISECAAKGGECDETKGRPVCGTDKQTYPTRCHLIRAQCSGHQVSLKHRGSCKECIESRTYALSHRSSSPSKFVPRCRTDGSYAHVQCMEGAGCWCSDSTGKPIRNTTTRNGKPNCRKNAKSNTRRSPARNMNNNRDKRGCNQVDQTIFNTNLIKVFQSEYNRYQSQHMQTSLPTTITNDKVVLDWKFSALDTNNNNMLDKNEYRDLKRLAKKVVKPKRCARAFGKFCDIDHDERLSRTEWGNCLSKDAINRGPSFTGGGDASSSASNGVHFNHAIDDVDDDDNDGSDQHLDDYDESDDYEDDPGEDDHRFNTFGGIASRNPNSPVTPYPPVYLLRQKTIVESDPVLRESESDSDCLADRATALDDQNIFQQSGAKPMYVPECTADGRYQRVQCYRSTGYCWCVHEDTGKNIPGTSVKDKRPQCDSIYPTSRPIKGCPEPKKTEFLRDLKEFLKVQVASNVNTGANTTNWTSEDERIATLSFVLLDKNKNKVWERKEWKTFRELVTASKSLRKCGKKMPRYCDVNSDKKITLSEWLNCLQAQRITVDVPKLTMNDSRPAGTQSKLKGPNPLESYLKSD